MQTLLNPPTVMADLWTKVLLSEHPPAAARFAAYALHHTPRPDNLWRLGTCVENEVFGEWFRDSPETLHREYGPYNAASMWLTVIDGQRNTPAGVLRVIQWSRSGFKTLCDVYHAHDVDVDRVCTAHGITDLSRVWDVGTLAVRRGYGDGQVSSILYGLLQQQCLAHGIEYVVTVLDEHVLGLLRALGVPMEPIAGTKPFPYMGSAKSIACAMRVAGAGPAVLAKLGDANPLARMLALGEGLPPLQVVR